ncbi:MAG: substrate-binding domain-containing protein [Alistipes sp.]|nr:substrate-binding domain-containing protein [Alistipes sp.]
MLAAAVVSTILAGSCTCERRKSEEQPVYTIGFSQCTSDMWRQIMMIQMEAEVTKYPNLRLIIKEAHNDSERQIRQIDELLDANVDLLIVSPNESEPITPVAVEAYDSGVPTIIWDRKIDSDRYTTCISADNCSIGRDVGEYVRSILPEGSAVLEIWGLQGSSPAQERHKGFVSGMDGRYRIRQIVGNWYPEVARARVEDIADYDDIDLVFGHNDEMALAAYDAIASRDSLAARRIKFIGIDAIVGVDAVIDGRLEASFLYPPGGEFVIETAMKILRGEPVDKTYTLKSSIVDRNNAVTLKAQSEQIFNYQNHINRQRRELDSISNNYAVLKHSSVILVVVLVFSLFVAVASLVVNRRIHSKNRILAKRNDEIERHTEELVLKNARIESLTNQKLQFFTNLSHEVRTPLTLILNPLDKIAKSEQDPSIRRNIWTIQRNAKHLLKIVNQILDFRKIENNKMVLQVSQIDIVPFTNEILKYFEAYAESEKIVYKFRSTIASQMLWIDADKIEQVLINLISNAFKNSRKYGIITVSITDNGSSVIIEVHDTGRGIARDAQQHIFDRFYSIDNSSSHGIGIGLHLTKEYVEMHKGCISVDSEPDKYTSFYVELLKGRNHLPSDAVYIGREGAADSVEGAELSASVRDKLARRYPDTTVLIAEDDDDIRSYLASELAENFNVIVAGDGYEATQAVIENNVSIVVSDVLMPRINGFQLCRNIKTDVATSHIPVILLTALTDDSQRIYGIAEGADEYIRKPFNIDYVKIKIIRMVEERRQMVEMFARRFNADKFLDVDVKDIPCSDDIFRDRLFDLTEAQYADSEFSIEQMSDKLCMSRVHLYRKTKSLFGMSPTDLLCSFRLKKAVQMLKNGTTVSEAAYASGFASPTYFTKCFKKEFGCTPTEFIRRNTAPQDAG